MLGCYRVRVCKVRVCWGYGVLWLGCVTGLRLGCVRVCKG